MKELKAPNVLNTKFLLRYLLFICFVLFASYTVSEIYTPHIAVTLAFRIITWIIIPFMIGVMLNKGALLKKEHRFSIYILVLISSGVLLGIYPNPKGVFTLLIFNSISERQINLIILPAVAIITIVTVTGGKLICGWACPLGAFQEIIYNLHNNDRRSSLKIKIPFFITNSTRILFFAAGIFFALVYFKDIITYDSPFGIFKPGELSATAIIIIIIMTLTSPFIYRPWCLFLCPFGMVSWLYEKIAVFRIKIDKSECTGCGKCANACPVTTMQALLNCKSRLFTPDCWTCGRCLEACPKNAVHYTSRRY
jgi:polyferredoxin